MSEFDFTDEAFAQLGGDNPEPEEPETPPGEVVLEGTRERDEQGRFVAKKDEPLEQTDEPAAEEPILGKFKSQDELVQAYQSLEQKLGDPDRLDLENRRLREELDEIKQMLQAPATPAPQFSPDHFNRLVEEDPAQAAQIAYDSGDGYRVREALNSWKDIDPFAAAVWVGEKRREEEMAALRAQYDEQFAPMQQESQNQQFARAWRDVAGKYPDIQQVSDEILTAAQTAPEIVGALRTGTYDDKMRVIENLYWLAKGRKADTLASAVQQMAEEKQEADRQRKQDAAVAGGSSAQVQEEKTPVQNFYERILQAPNVSIREGLTQ